MHFAIPDVAERTGPKGAYTVFNIHINGVHHCAIRYSEVEKLQARIKAEYPDKPLTKFPPKRLLALTLEQLEERRRGIEMYLQAVGEDPLLVRSLIFRNFLIESQEEMRERSVPVEFPIKLPGGTIFTLKTLSLNRTERTLALIADKHGMTRDLVPMFGLFLEIESDEPEEEEGAGPRRFIKRRIQHFESPYLALMKAATRKGELCLRSTFWDPALLEKIYPDQQATEWIYQQTVADANNGWMSPPDNVLAELKMLKKARKHKEFLQVASKLDTFGYIELDPCVCSHPAPDSRVIVAIGSNDLRVRLVGQKRSEAATFRVRRTRCWKLSAHDKVVDFAFDYLFGPNELRWVTMAGPQTIYMSMCVQSVVDELLEKIKPSPKGPKPDYGPTFSDADYQAAVADAARRLPPPLARQSSLPASPAEPATPTKRASEPTAASTPTPKADKPAAEKTAEKAVEKAAEKTVEMPAEQPAEKPVQKPIEKPVQKPAEKPAEKPVEKPAEKPAEKAAEKPAIKSEGTPKKAAQQPSTPTPSASTRAAASDSSSSSSYSPSTSSTTTGSRGVHRVDSTSAADDGYKKKLKLPDVFKSLKSGKSETYDNAMYDGTIGDDDL
ncbi:hypothetical protein CAOG_01595 [Capsaspora owczarzaki ATCC 30864]|uniref:PX domain-containing protein n=1 Tax=Capsaspora owczarzaki (strain ATCC 30864) TaxID=595528 RepID=A0A0D2WKR4_CAPO3|nr:hypothetical protein CAOG_01595 [Capsaspora owczarzaki ATCC 30864]KJE90258.1 hypothetical protein CAOG_001595 [Capsaspora owczarzaki ATCC 30864]|eukprot:XP_004364463.1 hypothetical protein CAOG_01595 [Capsaspora owczarzaki ATCC 30864]